MTPTVVGAGEYDYAQRDLRWTNACSPAHEPGVRRAQQGADAGLALDWVPQALEAARALQPLWSQPDAKPPRFEDSLDRAKSRFAGIVSDSVSTAPKELKK